MPDQDTLSPEDSAALVHAQQQLYSAGDPRAAKLYNYIVQAGYATKGDNGELHPQGETKSFYDKYIKGTLSGNAGWQQAIDKAATPPEIHSAGDVANALGAGTTQMFGTPVAHPLRTIGGVAKMAAAGLGDTQAQHDVAGSMVRPFVENPSGSAVAAIPQAALALVGGGEAEGAGQSASNARATLQRSSAPVARATEGAVNRLSGFADGTPEQVITRVARPNKNNVSWNSDTQTAIPLMKSAEKVIGKPIDDFESAITANNVAKKQIWAQVQQRMQAAGQAGATIDGNAIADAIMQSVDKRTALKDPALAQRVQQFADTYRRPIPVNEAEDFLQSGNAQLNGYYAKNKVGRQAALNDPETASTVFETDALRDALYNKIDQLSGPGASQLKKAYGALKNVGNALETQKLVYDRKAPTNMPEQLSYLKAGGKILTGNVPGGVKDIAVQRFLSEVNDQNAMIGRAFQKAQPAGPFPAPITPRFAGLLERGPIQVGPGAETPLDVTPPAFSNTTRAQRFGRLLPEKASSKTPLMAPDPGMTPGERVAAMRLEALRRFRLGLPAKASPIQLPPPQ